MVVAVTPNLDKLMEGLKSRGYTVVILGQYDYPIDAMIYTGYSGEISYTAASNDALYERNGNNYGILMINAENKTLDQIDTILKNRVYTPLF